jgi:hypothetical protein
MKILWCNKDDVSLGIQDAKDTANLSTLSRLVSDHCTPAMLGCSVGANVDFHTSLLTRMKPILAKFVH